MNEPVGAPPGHLVPGVEVDVAVVGGGPAGAAAARAAARGGARTLLLERAVPPRYKCCGGGLIALSTDLAGIDVTSVTRQLAATVEVSWRGRLRVRRRSAAPLFRLVLRDAFDAALLDDAAAAGARIWSGATVTGLLEDDDGVTLTVRRAGRPASTVRAGTVIGADGSVGRCAAHVGARFARTDLGLEGEFPTPAGLRDRWAGTVWLDWGPVPGSYAWVFPKGELLTVGVIGDRAAGEQLRGYYREVVERVGLTGVVAERESGHLTRCRARDSPLVSPGGRVWLAGDAAGLVEPWTREGISGALRSGRLAGEAAAAGAGGDRYGARVLAVLGADLAAGDRLLETFARHPLALHVALVSPPGWRAFRRVVAGQASFAGLLRRAPVRLMLAALNRRRSRHVAPL